MAKRRPIDIRELCSKEMKEKAVTALGDASGVIASLPLSETITEFTVASVQVAAALAAAALAVCDDETLEEIRAFAQLILNTTYNLSPADQESVRRALSKDNN